MPAKKTTKKATSKTTSKKSKKFELKTAKGLRDIEGAEYLAMQGFLEKASEIALYYGFTPIELPMLEYEEIYEKGTGVSSDIVAKELYSMRTKGGEKLAIRPEFTPGIMRAYVEHGMHTRPQPVMLFTHGPLYRYEKPQKGRYREHTQFDIEVLGTDKSIADAMTIKVFMTIIEEAGVGDAVVRINSIGDKDSRPTYRRELVNYYKKHLSEICKDCHRRLKDNPLRLLDCKEEGCEEVKAGAPGAINFLSESGRRHFKEVLEYLEALEIPYQIDHTLVRGLDYYTHTVYEVFVPASDDSDEEGGEKKGETMDLALGGGGRYDYLAKQLGHNKPVPAVGFGMGVDRVMLLADKNKVTPRIVKKPKVYFIQLGFEAKLKSLQVIDALRIAKVPVHQSVSKDSLTAQLGYAEKTGVPFVLILGTKEALENSVIVRDMKTRSQETVSIDSLPEHLKKLK